ncbi:MAG: winged helix-turn-helix domain-containing protein [Verrucomicrobia bacterium]|nr:winged helix-turn-helix domain-containing protein [Verrucomicrobiota bacterium]
MKSDSLEQYLESRSKLFEEKVELEERLQKINEVLGQQETPVTQATTGNTTTAKPKATRGRPRGRPKGKPKGRPKSKGVRGTRNKMSLRDAIIAVTSERPMSKEEILNGVQKLGYHFSTKDPINSINSILYSKKQFKKEGGKFSPLK